MAVRLCRGEYPRYIRRAHVDLHGSLVKQGGDVKFYATSVALAACLFAGLALFPVHALASDTASQIKQLSSEPRASMEVMPIPTHGVQVNAMVYVAAGAGPHPLVLLLHGFPGYERNLDLAQDIRRAGWDVVYVDYRGSWGSPGNFSLTHSMEDAAAALAYLRQPENIKRLRFDPARIVVIGHSMGGFMAVQAVAADPAVKALAIISGSDWGERFEQLRKKEPLDKSLHMVSIGLAAQNMAPLSGCTPDGLARELADHAASWTFRSKVDALKGRPVLVITSDDGLAGEGGALADDLRQAGDARVTTAHFPTDHSYSDQRRELSDAVLQWLAPLAQ